MTALILWSVLTRYSGTQAGGVSEPTWEWEGVGENDIPDLVVSADKYSGPKARGESEPTWEWEGVGENDSPDLVVSADKVQRYKGQPVDCVDTVREENEPAITRSENSECTQMINF